MKRNLKEELRRIHSLTYGNEILAEQNFVDKILNTIGNNKTVKVDDPKKADLVEPDVVDFYNTIQFAADSGGLSQQKYGKMKYKKEVESMQIGLILLGYTLPRYGVDGLFGPETASAVVKFNSDNGILENMNEAMIQLNSTSYSNVKFDRDDTQYDMVSGDLLNDLQKAAISSGVIVTITSAQSGHKTYTKGSSNISRHTSGSAVDISLINGKPVLTNKEDTNKFVNALSNLGYVVNQERGNQKAVLTYGFPGHDNHVHVSNNANVASGTNKTLSTASPFMLKKLLAQLKQKDVTSEDLKKYVDKVVRATNDRFTELDLTKNDQFNLYGGISQKFIDQHQPNPLNITGEMMSFGAKQAFERYNKYVPPELALAQLYLEGGIGSKDPNAKPVRTKNPFNVGNTDDGSTKTYLSVQDGINAYYNLIAKNYLGHGRTATDLVSNFVNHSGNRYASTNYEYKLNKLIPTINNISRTYTSQS